MIRSLTLMKEILLRHIIKTNPWKINALIWKYIKSSPNGSSFSHLPTFLRVKTDGCVRFVASMETVMITGERRKKTFSSKGKAKTKKKETKNTRSRGRIYRQLCESEKCLSKYKKKINRCVIKMFLKTTYCVSCKK